MREDVYKETRRLRNLDIKVNISETAKQLNCDWRTAKKYLSTELTDDKISFDNPNFISNQVEFLNVKTISNISEIRSH